MEQLLIKSRRLIQQQKLGFERSLASQIDWNDRLVGIIGARGTGKTTLLLQQLKKRRLDAEQGIYVSLDDIYFTVNQLVDTAEQFVQNGGKLLCLDEVHKYPTWAREVKNLYDTYSDLQIVFSGSSITDILRQNVDLSRRAVQYELPGLSYREFLAFTNKLHASVVTLPDLWAHHEDIAADVVNKIKPLQHLAEYLQYGYYPFFAENKNTYSIRLEQVIKMVTEIDLKFIEGFDPGNTRKIYQLLYVLSTNVPFKPNVAKLSEKIGVHRNTLPQYLHHLERARLINTLHARGRSISTLQKPEKIYLENSNLQYALGPQNVNRGTLRETFLLSQLRNAKCSVSLPTAGDFFIDENITVEVGGKDKNFTQIKNAENAFIVADDLETGVSRKIPMWLFGFLY